MRPFFCAQFSLFRLISKHSQRHTSEFDQRTNKNKHTRIMYIVFEQEHTLNLRFGSSGNTTTTVTHNRDSEEGTHNKTKTLTLNELILLYYKTEFFISSFRSCVFCCVSKQYAKKNFCLLVLCVVFVEKKIALAAQTILFDFVVFFSVDEHI